MSDNPRRASPQFARVLEAERDRLRATTAHGVLLPALDTLEAKHEQERAEWAARESVLCDLLEHKGYVLPHAQCSDAAQEIAAKARKWDEHEANPDLCEATITLEREMECHVKLKLAEAALEEIEKGEGAFKKEPLEHAENVIKQSIALAREALAAIRSEK